MLVSQGDITYLQVVGSMMIVLVLRMREGEELKAPRYASAAATRDRNLRQSAGNLWQIAGTINIA